jgi:hypothetical protein
MKAGRPKDIAGIFRDGRLIGEALRKGVLDALRRHKLAGLPVVEWRDGKAVWISPQRIGDRSTAIVRESRDGRGARRSPCPRGKRRRGDG